MPLPRYIQRKESERWRGLRHCDGFRYEMERGRWIYDAGRLETWTAVCDAVRRDESAMPGRLLLVVTVPCQITSNPGLVLAGERGHRHSTSHSSSGIEWLNATPLLSKSTRVNEVYFTMDLKQLCASCIIPNQHVALRPRLKT